MEIPLRVRVPVAANLGEPIMRLATATVLQRGTARFTMSGQSLPYQLTTTGQGISSTLVTALRDYASERLAESGFMVADWDCEVSTADADEPEADRFYVVDFTNAKGGKLGVQGILLCDGAPGLDHGLCIEAA